MFESKEIDATRLIVAQDQVIRQALNSGRGPEYLLHYYQSLTEAHQTYFVAALAGMVSMNHARNVVESGRGAS